jgi:hypothetical protein
MIAILYQVVLRGPSLHALLFSLNELPPSLVRHPLVSVVVSSDCTCNVVTYPRRDA